MYHGNGFLKDLTGADAALCNAAVHCPDRLINDNTFGSFAQGTNTDFCTENIPGSVYTLEDCPVDVLPIAKAACEKEFSNLGKLDDQQAKDDFFNDCTIDACFDAWLATVDAEDAKNFDIDEKSFDADLVH